MRVGVLSKPAHCKSQVSTLKQAGYKVEVLGGDPGISIPNRIDLLVVRVPSISHDAFNVAKEWERKGNPVIYEDGAARILQAIQELSMPTGADLLRSFLDINLWVSSHMMIVPPEWLPRFIPDERARKLWEEIEASDHNESFIRSTASRLARDGEFERYPMDSSWLGVDEGQIVGPIWPHATPSVYIHTHVMEGKRAQIQALFCAYLRSKGRLKPLPASPALPPIPFVEEEKKKENGQAVQPPLDWAPSPVPSDLPEEVHVSLDMLIEAMDKHGFQHVGVDVSGAVSFIRQVLVEGKVKLGKGSSND